MYTCVNDVIEPAKPVITSATRLCRLAARASSCLTSAGESGPRRVNSWPMNLNTAFERNVVSFARARHLQCGRALGRLCAYPS